MTGCPTCGMQLGQCVHATDGSLTVDAEQFGANYSNMADGYSPAQHNSAIRDVNQAYAAAHIDSQFVSYDLSPEEISDEYADRSGAENPTRPQPADAPVAAVPASVSVAAGGADFYRVELDTKGCTHCGHGDYWTVTWDQDGEAHQISSSSDDKESIEFICESMNSARELALRDATVLAAPLVSAPSITVDTVRHKLDTDTQVFFYEQEFYPLSNFSAFSVYIFERRFDTAEHAYHFAKFDPTNNHQHPHVEAISREIYLAPSAHEAFKIAERNKRDRLPDWDYRKTTVMREILRAKVEQHEYVKLKLLETGDRELIEDSWRDDVWGWGPNRDGQNLLGNLWMEIRAELRNAPPVAELTDSTEFDDMPF